MVSGKAPVAPVVMFSMRWPSLESAHCALALLGEKLYPSNSVRTSPNSKLDPCVLVSTDIIRPVPGTWKMISFPSRRQRGRRPPALETCHLRSEEHTSELQSHVNLVCRLLLE